MDRKEFLSILAISPFAIKTVAGSYKEQVKNKKQLKEKLGDNALIPQCLIKDSNGRKIALVQNIDFEFIQENIIGESYNNSWNLSFDSSPSASDNFNKLVEAMQKDEVLSVEIYDPQYDGLFYTGNGYLTDLSISSFDMTIDGFIQGTSEAIRVP